LALGTWHLALGVIVHHNGNVQSTSLKRTAGKTLCVSALP